MQDVTDIAHVYYRIDSGEWINTGVTQGTCTGYQVDISGLADGKHRIEVCGEDALGNMGDTVIYTYDEAGNILTSTDSLGNVSSYEYDMAGNCTAAIDLLGNRMEWTYDAAGNKTSEQAADGTVKKWIYDASGNITSETDGEGNTTVT